MSRPSSTNGAASPPRESGAPRVAAGILLSRLAGLVRESTLAYFLGAGPHTDVFRTALRGPNVLQNLLGEQTLSASTIPIYTRLVEEGRREEAGRFAGAIFGLLLAVAGGLTLIGVWLARPLVALLAAGYLQDAEAVAAGEAAVDRFPLAVRTVRIIFPMTGLLVLSAWCLTILNSHRRFFLPYFAPVLWNAAIVAGLALAASAGSAPDRVLVAACLGALVGGGLQFLVQVPLVARLLRGFRLSFSLRTGGVRQALASFAPLAAGRGVVQLSVYLDHLLATFLAAGAVAGLGFAAPLYLLPISLFGMSVAAAELPELSRRGGATSAVFERVGAGYRQTAFLTVPTSFGYLLFGFLVVGVFYRRGSFGVADHWLVYLILAAYALGLVASSTSRLLQTVFYASGETRLPARVAVERVTLSAFLGAGLMLWLDRFAVADLVALPPGAKPLHLGAVGLAAAAAVAAWYELVRLRRSLARSQPDFRLDPGYAVKALAAAVAVAPPAVGAWWLLSDRHLSVQAAVVLPLYAVSYFALTHLMGISEIGRWLGRRRSGSPGEGPRKGDGQP